MRILPLVALSSVYAPLVLFAYREGPPPHVTGGFSEASCLSCHFDNPLNAPGGALAIDGVPPTFVGGQVYRLVIELARNDMRLGGFQVAARFADGAERGRQAGIWRVLDERVQVVRSPNDDELAFVEHSADGSMLFSPGIARWTVEWSAPSSSGTVEFNAAANAANDDGSSLGDYIYLATARAMADRAGRWAMGRPGVLLHGPGVHAGGGFRSPASAIRDRKSPRPLSRLRSR
jgi:hypothetical protein